MLTRRSVLRGTALAGGAALSAASGPLPARAPSASAHPHWRTAERDVFTFVSLPDFFNGDVGDLRHLPTWDGGLNSINDSWQTAIETCLDGVQLHAPDAVFLAGDMVEGRWNIDSDGRGLFGPVSPGIDAASLAACERAITAAGSIYYAQHKDRFATRHLPLYPAVGDHEILDDREGPLNDRWSPGGMQGRNPDNRYYLVPHAKRVWASHFTRTGSAHRFGNRPAGTPYADTAYAVNLGANLTLVTVDVFAHTRAGVRLGVFGGQLEWLGDTVRDAKAAGRVVIVQGHIPIMAPYRSWHSGNLRVPEGRASGFYRTLDAAGADFYLTGEVHDTTVIQHGRGPIQISHGCIFRYGFNYLAGTVHADGTTELHYYEAPVLAASRDHGLWCSDVKKRQRTQLTYGTSAYKGTLVARKRVVSKRTAKLGVFTPEADPWSLKDGARPAPL